MFFYVIHNSYVAKLTTTSWGNNVVVCDNDDLVCLVVNWVQLIQSSLNHGLNDPKLPGDSGEVPISKWNGQWFDSHCDIFSLLDGEKKRKEAS